MREKYRGFWLKAEDGHDIYLHAWDQVDNPRGILQIFHGMAEHGKRYEGFAQYMNEHGFIVYADDHRGHGRTAGSLENIGYIGEDGFNKLVQDEYLISKFLKEKYPWLPLFIVAHSFGSFVAQEYIIRYGWGINGLVLSGSAAMNTLKAKLGYILASIERLIHGEKYRSRFLDWLSFGTFNRRIKNNPSKFAWLSTDEKEVRKYEEDPYCGGIFTTGFFYYLSRGFLGLYRPERLANLPKDLPILIIAGEEDPVGEYGRLVKRLYNIYKEAGCQNVDLKLYPGKRHELFNEVNREEVYADVLNWLDCITGK
ncbi:alpha/beta hydrolase [Caldicellulosiruptor acetigenus]|uniref:alpha/beta hydrolase n=1 Tax=Caldicellulosiruptor acetigenus TaxID=301953 RepID=UPI000415176E|nr:alpha/beta hydrolase [Caldicellulosiruptor acetigenus]WAM36424.1 alpha/beta hydrolase [Caldicellulosiruptor acetigenus]